MGGRPLGAILSQFIVAGSSLLLQFVALRELGAAGLGSFSLLLGVLITVNSVQTGWIGDSLTVLDRFEPGMRRALFQSQYAAIVLVGLITTMLALPVGGVDGMTAVLFGVASVMWIVEETLRRVLIARREFWKLVVNDASFAAGSFGLLALVALSGSGFSLQTLVLALLSGAVVAIAVGVVQLPRVELSRGMAAPSRLRELASFAVWRSAQIGLRPGGQALVRAVVATAISLDALGRLEAARLLIAPVLTIVNGAGVYLLPTYAAQVKRGARFRPGVTAAMLIVGGLALGYGAAAMALRGPLVSLLTDGTTVVTVAAIGAWAFYSAGFGAGVPAGNAMVALGRSRDAFRIRVVDAGVGVTLAAVFAFGGQADFVPAGLGIGTVVGAVLLRRSLEHDPAPVGAVTAPDGDAGIGGDHDAGRRPPAPSSSTPAPATSAPATSAPATSASPRRGAGPAAPTEPAVLYEAQVVPPPPPAPARWSWQTAAPTGIGRHDQIRIDDSIAAAPPPRSRTFDIGRPLRRTHAALQAQLLWFVPLAMIVATEYKIRRRSIDDALSGSIDLMILLELAVYGLVGIWVVWRLVPTRPRLQPLLIAMWGYILTTAASAIYAEFPTLALARAVELVIVGLVIHLIAVEGTLITISRLLHGWIVLISVSIVVGLAYVFPTTGPQEGRFTWLSVHSVSAGSMFAVSVPIAFGLWLSSGRRELAWPRWVYGCLFATHVVFLLLTRTRGSIGGALVGVAVMAWVWSGRRMKPELVLGSLVFAGALALAFGRPVLDFLTRGETVDQIGTFNRRTEIWSLAWQSFLHHPFFGLGFTSAKGAFFAATGLGGGHNATINVMADTGLAGLLWWSALLVATLVALRSLWVSERRSLVLLPGATGTARSDQVIMLGIFVSSLVNSITTEGLGAGVNVAAIWWFLCVAWIVILQRQRNRTPEPAAALSAGAPEIQSEAEAVS